MAGASEVQQPLVRTNDEENPSDTPLVHPNGSGKPGNGKFNGSTEQPSDDSTSGGTKLKRRIGLLQGCSIILGIVIGSGIFISPVGVLKRVRSPGLSFVIWFACGLFSLIGALCYAEIGTTIPRSGGEYIYIKETLGPLVSFLALWIIFVSVGAVANACNSLIFAEYFLKPFFGDCAVPETLQKLVALLVLLVLSTINCFSVKFTTRVAIVFTITKVTALVLVIAIGFYHLLFTDDSPLKLDTVMKDSDWSIEPLAIAFYSGFWAFAGWNYLNYLTEEMKTPTRTLPIAIIISLVFITIIYLLANVAYLSVLTPGEMVAENSVVAITFAGKTMGIFKIIMPILVACSVFGSLNGEILGVSRGFMIGAYEGHLPSIISMINYNLLTPLPSVMVLTIFSMVFLLFGNVFYLIDVTGFAACLLVAATVGGMLYFRYTRPDLKRPFRMPIVLPWFLFIWTLLIIGLTVYQQPREAAICIVIILTGIPAYWIGVCWKTKPRSMMLKWDRLTIFLQQLLLVVPQPKKEKE